MKFVIILLITLICAIQYLTIKDASDSGKDFSLRYNIYLEGQLKDRKGAYHFDRINLSVYVANNDGNLEYNRAGGYENTCSNCSINQRLILSCDCKTNDGKLKRTSIRIGTFMQNDDGFFAIGRSN